MKYDGAPGVCHVCHRRSCRRGGRDTDDCAAHAVDWRAIALGIRGTLEQALPYVEVQHGTVDERLAIRMRQGIAALEIRP